MKFIVALLTTFTLIILCNCGGRVEQADCSYEGKGAQYCRWEIGGRIAELCCPGTYPYCGHEGTTCPVGKCCNTPPLAL
jgi:hypothetical protein